jgi:hypothetical protein
LICLLIDLFNFSLAEELYGKLVFDESFIDG